MFINSVPRGGKIGPARWASSVCPKLGPGWAIKLLARKKPGQIWPGPVWPSPVWPSRPGPVFRAGWAVKILARKNRANFGPARFWPGPLLALPSPARPARLPPLSVPNSDSKQCPEFKLVKCTVCTPMVQAACTLRPGRPCRAVSWHALVPCRGLSRDTSSGQAAFLTRYNLLYRDTLP